MFDGRLSENFKLSTGTFVNAGALRVAAVSAITNLAEGMSAEALSHEQTLRDAARASGDLARLLLGFLDARP